MNAIQEIEYGKQLSDLATELRNSTKLFSDLVMAGYRSDDLEALDKFISGLTNAMQGLTKLIQDQATIVETAVVVLDERGNI